MLLLPFPLWAVAAALLSWGRRQAAELLLAVPRVQGDHGRAGDDLRGNVKCQ